MKNNQEKTIMIAPREMQQKAETKGECFEVLCGIAVYGYISEKILVIT